MSDSSSKTKEEENSFSNYKFLDEIRKTPLYLKAKDRIELVEDIFSINEETYPKVLDKLREYLKSNDDLVEMFFFVSILYILTRYKSAHKFGFSLFTYFKENYLNRIENVINIQRYLYFSQNKLLKDIKIKDLITNSSKDFSFYDYEPNTISYFLFNDDISGLQDYVSKVPNIDFNEPIKIKWIPYETLNFLRNIPLNIFEHSILFGSLKCFKFILLQDEVKITEDCTSLAAASGNSEIIHNLEHKDCKFDKECCNYALMFHQNNIFEWIIRNYATDLNFLENLLEDSISYFNEELLYYIINNGGDLLMNDYATFLFPVQDALNAFNIPLFKYLYENYYQDINLMSEFEERNLFPLSCQLNQIEIVKYFITTGKISIETADPEGYRPLHFACQCGSLPIVEYLISLGCEINSKTNNMDTPFSIACKHNNFSVTEYFLKNLNLDIKSQNLDTLFQYACQNENFKLVKFLIEHGYDPTTMDINEELPFFNQFNPYIVEYLASVFKDKIFVDSKGRTFLHYAALFGDLGLVQFFSSLNTDKDIKDKNEMTPLHFACYMGELETVKYLISINANKDSIDKFGRIPMHYACLNEHFQVYEYLVSIGSNPSIEDIDGKTPSKLIYIKLFDNSKYQNILDDISMPI